MNLDDISEALENIKNTKSKSGNDYKINKAITRKLTQINESQQELYELIQEIGNAQALAWFKILIDDEIDYKTIRKEIDKSVEYLSLDALEFYIEAKSKMRGDMI